MSNKIQSLQDELGLQEEKNKLIKAPWENKDVRARKLQQDLKALEAKYGIFDKTSDKFRRSGWSLSSSVSNSPKLMTFLEPGSGKHGLLNQESFKDFKLQ